MIQMIKSPIANPIMWKQKHLLSGMVVTLGAVSLIISNLEMIASMLTKVFQIAPWESMGGALLIFGLRLTDVPIGTLKTVLMVRGVRTWATLLGLLEVTIWITAMGRVMGQLDNPWNIAGYALGYSVGTWLGMWIENRLAFGSVEVHTISLTKSTQVAEAIRAAGYGVTQFQGIGESGPVCIVGTIAERKHLDGLLKNIHEVDPGAFITVDDTRKVIGGHRTGK
ncbi:DUF2179 domain-containing protein [Candidatus Villigracilis affinis]|uniref:DUF2179 domain-containing protein n=1 Tax=Candidatus Villigracilis affinis TaxID=3140682 RepID=UPI002A1AC610|nr:DUF2179 domain-containing protein [Anaerolineales bacterium]